jgi:hypothetical protein
MGGDNDERVVLINEKPNQGVRERKKVGIHRSRPQNRSSAAKERKYDSFF